MKFACITKLLSVWRIRTNNRHLLCAALAMLVSCLLLHMPAAAQSGEGKTITVKGVITGAKGAPLGGVSLVVKGLDKATISQADGSFSITVPVNSTLQISHVGYADYEIVTTDKDLLSVSVALTPGKAAMDEVVVVGYGTRRKSEITGSVVSVNEQSIKDIPTQSVASALQGRAAGVDIQKVGGNSKPGAGVSILIRGARSVRASNAPLIVVDGIPFGGNFNDLNQDDITSVEILKDASSTAIYGSRGANGVILISTRRGKNGKPIVSYSGYAGVVKSIGQYHLMDAQEFAELKKWARYFGVWTTGNNPVKKYSGPNDPLLISEAFTNDELEGLKGPGTNWQDLIYKTGIQTDHQIGVSGGTEQTQYAISGGYYKETGVFPGQEFERFSIKLSVDQQLGKLFRVGLSSLNNYSTTLGEGFNPMSQALRASPLVGPYDSDGILRNDFLPGSQSQVWNPLADFQPGAKSEKRRRLGTFTSAYLDVNLSPLLKGLKYRLNAGTEIRTDVYGAFYASKSTNQMGTQSLSNNRTSNLTSWTLENLLTYDNTFFEKHKVNFTGLFSAQQERSNNNEFENRDIVADYLEYYNPEYGFNLTGSGGYSQWGLVSYMGRLNYGYDDRYLLTLTVRSDGSSRLAKEEQWQVFPSAAAAWNIHNEKFFKVDAISSLRLRASYGRVGNASISPYGTLPRLGGVVYNFGETMSRGYYQTNVGNNTLTWEYTSTAELGLDFGILNNRISGNLNFYKAWTDKLLLPKDLPPTNGIQNSVLTNVGKTENQGIEFQITSANMVPKGRNSFGWTTDLNFSINRGKITQLADGITQDIGNNWFVGQPIGVFYNYVKAGIWQNSKADSLEAVRLGQTTTGSGSVIGDIRVADLDGNGVINDLDRKIIGTTQPDWTGGMTNRFTYGGFDLTVVAFARWGAMMNSSLHGGGFVNTFQGTYNNIKTRYWTPTNGENEYPKPNYGRQNPTNLGLLGFFDGSFVKIRTISLGYVLPPSIIKRTGARNIRLYATARDPFILFSPFRNNPLGGLDPEAGGSASSPTTGTNLSVDTPPTWSLIFGLNVSF
ncbi:TonB-dependent receptor [Paraflavitalea sp. CAU 1676]|uniref:SusC/RagA family TonB-linked outer membrane protein n=1 Tax=Paraflavitalea sp. CAU 1676 TaxID=3032598 RepID=UPI0023DBA255|nr:TonB-dependent receptor [Paraflavitalea sp. CAU 1676]MDF2193323.1 TonB-dependent receptor [Paraflavitalea sp. CAU 1676]